MGRAHIPDAVLATAGSLQEVQAEPISSFPLDERPHVDTAAAPPADPVFVASPELVAEKQQQASELMLASTSKHKKRKQSAVGESLIASDSKRLHSSTAKLRQTDSPMGGNPAVKHGESASLQTAAGPASSGDDLQDQRQESLTLADSMDNSSPYEMEQPPGSPAPITDLQPSVPSLVDSVPDSSGALAAQVGVNAAVPASPADARNSDYQDAQERLSSPVHVSADPVRSGAEQPAESPSTSMHEDEHQAAAASPSPSDPPAQGAEAPRHLPVVLDLAQASPIHVCVEAEPDTSVLDKAEDSSSAAAAGLDAPITDSTADLQTNMASALGAAAAVPLPSSASIQGVQYVYAVRHKVAGSCSGCCRLAAPCIELNALNAPPNVSGTTWEVQGTCYC